MNYICIFPFKKKYIFKTVNLDNVSEKWPKEFLDQQDYPMERELLRTLAIARKTTRSFFNYAALVARGIPIIMSD